LTVTAAAAWCAAFAAPEIRLHLPLARTAYQCNELIDIDVLRSSSGNLPGGDLALNLAGEDGSHLAFAFVAKPVEPRVGTARAVEHLHLNGWLLRPGACTVEVACDGASAKTHITVHSHVRRSDFRLINWGRARSRTNLPKAKTASASMSGVNQESITLIAYANLVAQLRPGVESAALAKARDSAPAGRLVKLAAVAPGQTAVAYWGGSVSVFDEAGALKAGRRLSQDITAVAWAGSRLIVGDADGRVIAFKAP
jgi:hypothetical protein